jgi:hypothetical protein
MKYSLPRALTAGILLMAFGLAQAQVTLKNGHPDVYYVKEGDTLWDISSTFLKNPWQWPELWHVNEEIGNPHLIYPGDVIRLRYVDGEPQLQVERGDTGKMVEEGGGVVKLSPRAREVPLDTAIPAIPLDTIQPFLLDGLVVTAQEIREAPYVVGGQDSRVAFGQGDIVYARDRINQWANLVSGYGFYRVGEQYVDPDTQEILGYEARQVGLGQVSDQDDEILTLEVVKSSEDIRIEDRVFSSRERKLQSIFYPTAPEEKIEASIIRFFGRLTSVARNDVVVIDKGKRDGLEEGHVLEVMQAPDVVRDRIRDELIALPRVKAGTLVLFRVFEKVSYGLVIQSNLPLQKKDLVTNPAGSLTANQ